MLSLYGLDDHPVNAFEHLEETTMPGGNGRNSKRQTSRTHHDSVSQSGQQQRSQTPRPQRGNGSGGTRNPLAGNPLAMGYNPTSNPLDFSHGGSKKNRRKKGGGSR